MRFKLDKLNSESWKLGEEGAFTSWIWEVDTASSVCIDVFLDLQKVIKKRINVPNNMFFMMNFILNYSKFFLPKIHILGII